MKKSENELGEPYTEVYDSKMIPLDCFKKEVVELMYKIKVGFSKRLYLLLASLLLAITVYLLPIFVVDMPLTVLTLLFLLSIVSEGVFLSGVVKERYDAWRFDRIADRARGRKHKRKCQVMVTFMKRKDLSNRIGDNEGVWENGIATITGEPIQVMKLSELIEQLAKQITK